MNLWTLTRCEASFSGRKWKKLGGRERSWLAGAFLDVFLDAALPALEPLPGLLPERVLGHRHLAELELEVVVLDFTWRSCGPGGRTSGT